jgi:hypothetical protein
MQISPIVKPEPHYVCSLSAEELEDELAIVWLVDPSKFAYVRELHFDAFHSRAGNPSKLLKDCLEHFAVLVGYSVLKPSARSDCGTWTRRFWWLKDYDRHFDPGGRYADWFPTEAVDPLTIRAGHPGQLTERAIGRPLRP